MGASNGGLMAGVAATQRPDLWRAVVPRVPMSDLIGACREAYGRYVVDMEYADTTDADEVRRLASFSPYQLVQDGRHYPATISTRVTPTHVARPGTLANSARAFRRRRAAPSRYSYGYGAMSDMAGRRPGRS